MPVPEPDVSKVVYRVSRPDARRLHIEANITPAAPVSVLTMRETYGPALGFPSGISNVTVTGPDVRAAIEQGKLLVASAAPFTLSYDCAVPDYTNAVSLLRGFRRGRALFVPGMALFHRLHDQQTEYEVNIEAATVCSRLSSRSGSLQHFSSRWDAICCKTYDQAKNRVSSHSAQFNFGNETDLECAYFVMGDVVIRSAGNTRFVHEPDFPFAMEGLLEKWPRLAREVGRIFGDDQSTDWTVLLFASDEHLPGRPGVGFSLSRGALVSVSACDDILVSSHTLWLLLHERAHQWLGEAIARADPADDWFFEGFTNFTACEALTRAGLLAATERERLLSLSGRAIRQAKSTGDSALAQQGFLCAERWNRVLSRQGGSLADILAKLLVSHRGETLQGEALLAALAQASPGGRLPDFVLRADHGS